MLSEQDLKNLNAGTEPEKNNLEELIQKNLEISEEILHIAKKIKRHMFMQNVWGWIKVIIIVTPLIAGAIILKDMLPALTNVYDQYQEILNMGGQINKLDSINTSDFLKAGEVLKSKGIK